MARSSGTKRRGELVNPAHLLAVGNEKLEASLIPGLTPPTVASSQWEYLHAFGRAEGRTVLKPLHQAQSKGIELLDWRTETGLQKARQSVEAATSGFTLPIVLQRYLPGIADGEKRLWFVDGILLATIRKLPLPNDFRVNMDGGSRLAPAELDSSELMLLAAHKNGGKVGSARKSNAYRFLAGYSYTLFLTHYTVLSFIWRAGIYGFKGFVLSIVTANLIAMLIAMHTEKHHKYISKWLNNRLSARSTKRPVK